MCEVSRMDIRSVLIQHDVSNKSVHFCGIFYNNFVLFPASLILSVYPEIPDELKHISSGRLYLDNYLEISPKNTTLHTSTEITPVKFLAIFSCKNMNESKTIPISCRNYDDDNELVETNSLLSFFIVGTVSEVLDVQESVIRFFEDLLRFCVVPEKAGSVCIEATPFGNIELYGSISKGIVSNFFGVNNCYFITDAPVGPSCEGAPVFESIERGDRRLNGIVISSLNLIRGEHTGLTLALSLTPLLSQFLSENRRTPRHSELSYSNLKNIIDNSLARLLCGKRNSGTAILIDKDNAIFLTASHVVQQSPDDSLRLQWKSEIFPAYLIFKSKLNSAYDIALIQGIPNKIKNMTPIKFSEHPPKIGECIYAVGYPLFYHLKKDNSPTVTSGNVILCNSAVIYTNSPIINGASGGAIMDGNGKLLGIIISHATQMQDDGRNKIIYTRFNMSIPITAVCKPILRYLKTKDVDVLEELNCNEKFIINKWNIFHSKL